MDEVPCRTSLAPLASRRVVLCSIGLETGGGRGSFPLYGGTFAWSYLVSRISIRTSLSTVDTQTAVLVYPLLRFGSQHRIPKRLFVLIFWVYTAAFSVSARRQILPKAHVIKSRVSSPALYKTPPSFRETICSWSFFLLTFEFLCLHQSRKCSINNLGIENPLGLLG